MSNSKKRSFYEISYMIEDKEFSFEYNHTKQIMFFKSKNIAKEEQLRDFNFVLNYFYNKHYYDFTNNQILLPAETEIEFTQFLLGMLNKGLTSKVYIEMIHNFKFYLSKNI